MSYIYLSHFLNEHTPLYGGGKRGIEIVSDKDISKGDTANTKYLKMHNHSGTHIDFPNHFIADGKMSHHYTADFWIFDHPYLLDYPGSENELINPGELALQAIPAETDFLIIRTGFGIHRENEKYWKFNPGLSPELAGNIRQYLPKIRVIGADIISITSFQDRDTGRTAHRNFLGDDAILLVEDMKLDLLNNNPLKVMCFPLLAEKLDGAPVTIIAEMDEL